MKSLILSIVTVIMVGLCPAQKQEEDPLSKYYNRVIEIEKVLFYDKNGVLKKQITGDGYLALIKDGKNIFFRKPNGEEMYRDLSKRKYNSTKKGYEYSSKWGGVFIEENLSYIDFYSSHNFVGEKYTYYIDRNDYFVSKIPEVLRYLFYYDKFIDVPIEEFEELIERHAQNAIPEIESIELHTKDVFDKDIHVYGVSTYSGNYLSFYYDKNDKGDLEIKHIKISGRTSSSEAQRVLKSMGKWYGATETEKGMWIYASNRSLEKIAVFGIDEYGAVTITIVPDQSFGKK